MKAREIARRIDKSFNKKEAKILLLKEIGIQFEELLRQRHYTDSRSGIERISNHSLLSIKKEIKDWISCIEKNVSQYRNHNINFGEIKDEIGKIR